MINPEIEEGQGTYPADERLIKNFLRPSNNRVRAREFALEYARVYFEYHSRSSNVEMYTDVDYNRLEQAIWNYALEQIQEGNWTPMVRKLRDEGRALFTVDEEDSERLATSLINLAYSIR